MALSKAKALQEAEKSVAQGKIGHAIKLYQEIIENDPSDVSLLNTVGDLYIRERNVTEGLRQFHRLAEAYVRDGFNVKAIAIYRKITKVDPNSVETLLKLAELYQLQGLSREAREQYLQAAEFFKKRNQADRALEVLRKLVQVDPENVNLRNRYAAECEQAGKKDLAGKAYLEAAEVSLRHDAPAGAELALKKAAELDPKNSQVQLLRARVAMARQQVKDAEKIINSSAELRRDPAGMRILLDIYLASHQLLQAQELVMDVFRANPADFTPVSGFVTLCLEGGNTETPFQMLSQLADELVEQHNTGPLMDSLRKVWSNAPQPIPILEFAHEICERAANELTLPEVLEALAKAQAEAGNLEEAEAAYQKLTDREPENENYRGLLQQIQGKLGKEVRPVDFAKAELPLATAEEAAPEPVHADAERQVRVKEAIENSDLFARYNLVDKAIAELEKSVQTYPDQIEVHERILELSRKGFPERGAVAAAALARIYAEQGDTASANKYQAIASAKGAVPEAPEAPPPPPPRVAKPAAPVAAAPALSEAEEQTPTMEFEIEPIPPEEESVEAAPPPAESAFVPPPHPAPSEPPIGPSPPPESSLEMDLSLDLEAMTAPARQAAAPPGKQTMAPADVAPVRQAAEEAEAPVVAPPGELHAPPARAGAPPAFNFDDAMVEVDFYLENGFISEARQTVEALEARFPGDELVEELRRHLEERLSEAPTVETQVEVEEEEPAKEPSAEPALISEEAEHEDWELPTTYAAASAPPHVREGVSEPPPAEIEGEGPAAVDAGGAGAVGGLVGDFAPALDGILPPPGPTLGATTAPPPALSHGAAQLSGLLAEIEDPASREGAQRDDPETHYNLGVAFREMGLLDEAIGEFQKVVKGAGKGNYPANFLQACSLLAICFMEKKMPAIAVKWYTRALEAPDLDDEAILALQYDLGVAHELAGDARSALERFTEVYSQNIDFRDVAEKIRELQQRV